MLNDGRSRCDSRRRELNRARDAFSVEALNEVLLSTGDRASENDEREPGEQSPNCVGKPVDRVWPSVASGCDVESG